MIGTIITALLRYSRTKWQVLRCCCSCGNLKIANCVSLRCYKKRILKYINDSKTSYFRKTCTTHNILHISSISCVMIYVPCFLLPRRSKENSISAIILLIIEPYFVHTDLYNCIHIVYLSLI